MWFKNKCMSFVIQISYQGSRMFFECIYVGETKVTLAYICIILMHYQSTHRYDCVYTFSVCVYVRVCVQY